MADNAIPLERTLALIKPDSVDDSSEIERIIKTSGFAILAKRRVNLSPEQVSDFYAEHYGKVQFFELAVLGNNDQHFRCSLQTWFHLCLLALL